MTFDKMRFSDVWITLAFYTAVVCIYQAHCGPASPRKAIEVIELVEQEEEQEPAPGASFEDAEGQKLNFPASPDQSEGDDDGDNNYEAVIFRRSLRDISQKPAAQEPETENDEESVIPNGSAPLVPEKKPSVLELLSSALDKAIEATSKIPTQQVASDAAGVFQILGQVFSEAIDKVIGDDDGPEDATEIPPDTSDNSKEPEVVTQQPVHEEPPMLIVDQQQQESSQSDKEIVNNL